MNIKEYLDKHKGGLENLDAQILLAHIIGRPRTWLLAYLDTPLTPPQLDQAEEAFAKLRTGTPLPYILGHWEFFGLDLSITKDVLIPRPETELLVEKAITWLQSTSDRAHPEYGQRVADIGTGSGAIAVSIATHTPNTRILATDISPAALQVAKHNAEKFNVQHKIDFLEYDLLPASREAFLQTPLSLPFDLICANLPYIPTKTLHTLPIYGREPTLALDGGADGLELYRRLFELVPNWLSPHGMMLFEIESTLGVQAVSLAFDTFSNATIHLHQDHAGNDRLLEILPISESYY